MDDHALHSNHAHHALAMVMSGLRPQDVVALLIGLHGMGRAEAMQEAAEAAQFAMTHYGVVNDELACL